jgi:DNA-nicking Smr family endonuclease
MEAAFPLPKKPVRRQVLEGRRIGSPPLSKAPAQDTLDGSWDKRILKGDLRPDVSIDLHGETLASAHARLNRGLDAAIRRGDRVILLVTGKAAVDNPRLPPTSRGVIRASITDWLAASVYADRIAAIRNAHPRHGGAGALYLVLRKPR